MGSNISNGLVTKTNILPPIREAMKTEELANPHDAFKAGNIPEAVKHIPDELVDDASVIGSAIKCREKAGSA